MNIIYPKVLHVGSSSIEEYTAEPIEDIERDPRGLFLCWEPHDPKFEYKMGLDPTQGITGWNRGTRYDGDTKVDNAAIEIIKVDGIWEPIYKEEKGRKIPDIDPVTKQQRRLYKDVQVGEFAAPCDAVEIARVAYILGKIYAGPDEEECELIWEAWPGPGILTTQELLRLGYGNLWHWEYIDSEAEVTDRLGWRSTRESQKMLWYRIRRHLMNRQTVVKSKFLLAEYANAEIDMDKMRARAAYGYHDDRFQAYNMASWCGHKWRYDIDRPDEKVSETAATDFQRFAPTLDDCPSFEDWKANATADWE